MIRPLVVRADLTETQANNIATFAERFITEGNKRRDSKGYPLLAYKSSDARIEGYYERLYYIKNDYHHYYKSNGKKVYINGNRWVFNCDSFVSYVYRHVYGLILTKSKTSKTDGYSGLKIMSSTAAPWTMSNYINDAAASTHFYFIKRNIKIASLNLSILKKGDLIIRDTSHIMIYVGNGKIAHAATSHLDGSVKKDDMGLQVTNLKTRYPGTTISVARLKDHIISPSVSANMQVRWIDNGQVMNLASTTTTTTTTTPSQPTSDTTKPVIGSVTVNTNSYRYALISFSASDNTGIVGWKVTSSLSTPTLWNSVVTNKSISIANTSVAFNGTYYLWVKDGANNTGYETFVVSHIDSNKPVISSFTSIKQANDKYVLKVIANDNESGLATNAYSWDGKKTWQTINVLSVSEFKTYTVYVRDAAGNETNAVYTLKSETIDDKQAPKITYHNISTVDDKQQVSILASDTGGSGVAGYYVSKNTSKPTVSSNWVRVGTTNYSFEAEAGSYYLWVIDKSNNISNEYYKIVVEASNNSKTGSSVGKNILIIIISIVVGILGFYAYRYLKRNSFSKDNYM